MEPIIGRLKRALKMEGGVFQEIGADPAATTQAIVVAVAAGLIGGLGLIFADSFSLGGWLLGAILAPVWLAVITGVAYLVSRLFKTQGDFMSLFRAFGYASAPRALSLVPIVGWLAGGVWSLILAIRAVRETLEVSDGTAAAIVLIPVGLVAVVVLIVILMIGATLLGIGAAVAES